MLGTIKNFIDEMLFTWLGPKILLGITLGGSTIMAILGFFTDFMKIYAPLSYGVIFLLFLVIIPLILLAFVYIVSKVMNIGRKKFPLSSLAEEIATTWQDIKIISDTNSFNCAFLSGQNILYGHGSKYSEYGNFGPHKRIFVLDVVIVYNRKLKDCFVEIEGRNSKVPRYEPSHSQGIFSRVTIYVNPGENFDLRINVKQNPVKEKN